MSVSKRMALLAERETKSEAQPKNCQYLEDHCPVLLEMLTTIPDGAVENKTASLLVFCDDGEIKVLVNDRPVGRKAWMRLQSVDADFWLMVEDFVNDPTTDWRYPKVGDNGKSHY